MVLAAAVLPFAMHEWPVEVEQPRGCVYPGVCVPPKTNFSRVAIGPVPGQQWNINGGFCGAFSIQHAALAKGAWISQDLVRKANRDQPIKQPGHGSPTLGYEILPVNAGYSATALGLTYVEWDFMQPKPQAKAYKAWLKKQLVSGHAVVWYPICKGDSHVPYPGSCPNGGALDHVEAMYGIYSNHPLDDPNVYDDDFIVHTSDQDYMPYYRPLNSLEDNTKMMGNCKNAGAGFGKNEMYPCFDEEVTYGMAVTGLDVKGETYATALETDGAVSEPDIRAYQRASNLFGNVTVTGLSRGVNYILYRYDGTAALPSSTSAADRGFTHKVPFTATGSVWHYSDPTSFKSSSAVYYLTIKA